MDMVDSDPSEEGDDDYNLQDCFTTSIPYTIHNLIEYRIKLILKNDAIFIPGETQVVNTTCMFKGKIRGVMSMHLIPYKYLPLSFESMFWCK